MFSASLEQSEQFFSAAQRIGPETSPVLIFYGLSQAGRALAAAKAAGREPWTLSGHGLHCPNLGQSPDLGDIKVGDHGSNGSFISLSKLLIASTLPEPTTIRALWACLPDLSENLLPGCEDIWGAVCLQRSDGKELLDLLAWPPWVDRPVAEITHLPYWLAREEYSTVVRELKAHYPRLRHFYPSTRPEGGFSYSWHHSSRLGIDLTYSRPDDDYQFAITGLNVLSCGEFGYGDIKAKSTWLIPNLPGASASLHPLMLWWAVLFTLSMLARYRPTDWAKQLDVDRAASASPIEHILEVAPLACVNLLLDEFEHLTYDETRVMPQAIQDAYHARQARLRADFGFDDADESN